MVEKYNVSLKTFLQQRISEPEFYGGVVYRLRRIVGKSKKSNVSEQLRKLINCYKIIDYSLNIMRQIACLVINPIIGTGGHVFSVDPVGVGVLVGVASCLHSISLINGWILAKLTQNYHWMGEKCWLDFDDHDPIFKVTRGLRFLEKLVNC